MLTADIFKYASAKMLQHDYINPVQNIYIDTNYIC